MQHFAFGVVSIALAILFPLLYLTGYQMRRLAGWAVRGPAPRDRVGFFVVLSAIVAGREYCATAVGHGRRL